MRDRPSYPIDFENYEELIKDAYGDFDAIDLETPLIKGTIISKRFCKLFPKEASIQVQKLMSAENDELIKVLGRNFADMIVPFELHQRLYKASTKEELSPISTTFFLTLERGYTNRVPNAPPEMTFTEEFLKDYQKLAMPFTHKPIPSSLIEKIKQAYCEFESQILDYTDSSYQTHPADILVYKLQKIAEEYYWDRLAEILTVYPTFSPGRGADSSEWKHVLTIKWCEVILGHIQTIEYIQYQKEPHLLQVISQKAISLKDFLDLDIEVALALQEDADQGNYLSLEENLKSKSENSKYTKLIPWVRGEENLKSLWKMLDDHGYIEHIEFIKFQNSHFLLLDKPSERIQEVFTQKIIWKSSLKNLIMMIEKLNSSNIINAKPFNKKINTSKAGRIHNLIHSHFCRPDNKDITLMALRKTEQRFPNFGVDYGFNSTVMKLIRSIQ